MIFILLVLAVYKYVFSGYPETYQMIALVVMTALAVALNMLFRGKMGVANLKKEDFKQVTYKKEIFPIPGGDVGCPYIKTRFDKNGWPILSFLTFRSGTEEKYVVTLPKDRLVFKAGKLPYWKLFKVERWVLPNISFSVLPAKMMKYYIEITVPDGDIMYDFLDDYHDWKSKFKYII